MYEGRPLQEPESPRHAEVAAGVRQQLLGINGRMLLLSVNPFLSSIGFDTTAVDRVESVVRNRWPGNTPARRVVVSDWLKLPFADRSFAACVGDGSINALNSQDAARLYNEVARVLVSRGRFVCRVYLTPQPGESIAAVASAPWRTSVRSFVYFKFRLGMAIAAESAKPDVPVKSIFETFNANFPDRDRLAAATGWERSEIDRIDLYRSSPDVYCFPTGRQVLSGVPAGFSNVHFVPVGTYELAERCPLLVMDKIEALSP
jgi:SAM-dependent methyltransferase